MTYVYDLLVNFNDVMYDFYDWDKSDSFTHIRKVPLFKVSTSTLVDFMFKKVKVNKETLNLVKNKTEVFTTRSIERLEYSFILSDGVSSAIVLLNKSGVVSKKSKFLILEEMEISNNSKSLKYSNVEYEVLNKSISINKVIRGEDKVRSEIIKSLESIKDDEDKIKYLYYELFNIEGESDIYNKLVSSIKNEEVLDYNNFLNVLSMLCVKK